MQTTKPISRNRLRAMTETALLVAVGFALSYIKVYTFPQGGSITAVSLLPLLLIGQRHGPYWAFSGAVIYGGLQLLQEFWAPPVATAFNFFLVVALDYILAFGLFGFSFLFRKRKYGLLYAAVLCYCLRFLSHFTSGIIIWEPYKLFEPVWLYSAWYNGIFLGADLALCLVAGFFFCRTGLIQYRNPNKATG